MRLRSLTRAATCFVWLGAFSTRALAEDTVPSWLSVERGADATSCPDEQDLRAQVESLLEEVPQNARIRVQFRHTEGTFASEIQFEGARDVRVLSDTHPDCGPLGDATATSIALLLEMQEKEPPESPVEAPPASRPENEPERERRTLILGISGKGGVAQGAMTSAAALVSGEALFGAQWFRARLGAMYLPPQSEILGPGSVRQDLWAATTHLCFAPRVGHWLRVGGCTGAYAGILSVEARGFTENSLETRSWFAIPLEAFVSFRLSEGRSGGVHLQWGATALFPRGREEFVVQGIEQSVRTWRVPVLVWVGISREWEIAAR